MLWRQAYRRLLSSKGEVPSGGCCSLGPQNGSPDPLPTETEQMRDISVFLHSAIKRKPLPDNPLKPLPTDPLSPQPPAPYPNNIPQSWPGTGRPMSTPIPALFPSPHPSRQSGFPKQVRVDEKNQGVALGQGAGIRTDGCWSVQHTGE